MTDLPDVLNILLFMDAEDAPIAELEAVAPGRLNAIAVPAQAFVDDAGMLPATTGLWKPRPWSTDLLPEQLEQVLRDTHLLVLTLPYPKRLLPRMPSLLWAHYLWAGISDLQHSDLWGGRVRLTSSRGYVDTTPIAEMVIAAALHFAKDLHVAVVQAVEGGMDASGYDLRLLAGRTMGVVGLGGIGLEVARLANAMGMRVVASRLSITERQPGENGVETLYPAADLHDMLAGCDYVTLTTALTDDTRDMIDDSAVAAMKDGAVLLNVGRGELIDERALKDGLRSGKVGGAYLDVYTDEWFRPPDPELLAHPRVLMTPHNSGHVDVVTSFAMDLLKRNIASFLAGDPLINEVDWARGY
ncbi:MAG: D-2-hydroxyacid dehydrogenase [Chloroflexota bacterium]|nr:D-2-hydroxyacid dehydrogenase [Chloroflexota bacterium]MDE2885952.1 D-2-hydroxyacid dehydrogenase [Chloroflexota bacterium]